ncbi:hypothetical protein BC834DRAFT_851261 [Gloeopeniophorella convolvens]|nr:hypothetical protein BC834DRAFT_851261 [Gloeopeniophorella convolvens]
MSAWNIDYEHDTEEVIILKKHIAEQDNRYSTLQDNKSTLDDATYKLRHEADRALRLDNELRECKESLDKERMLRQNADLASRSAVERNKEEEVSRMELQQALEACSSRETKLNADISNLRHENVTLRHRAQELEANLQQVVSAATPKRGRPRSSSFSGVRITALERELSDSQGSVLNLQTDLRKAQDKLRRTEEDLFRVQNEKTVLERRTAAELKDLKEQLATKDEEVVRLADGEDAGLAREREDELIRRVEEEEAKVLALERLLSDTKDHRATEEKLHRAEKRVASETGKVKALEANNASLTRDMKRVRNELDESRAHIQRLTKSIDDRDTRIRLLDAQERGLRAQIAAQQGEILALKAAEQTPFTVSTSEHGHSEREMSAEDVEKLLIAIERLRRERDELRRQLEFLKLEHKFKVEALERRLSSLSSGSTSPVFTSHPSAHPSDDPRVSQLQSEVQALLERLATASSRQHQNLSSSAVESTRLGLIASASLVMVGHLQTRVDRDNETKGQVFAEISRLQSSLQDSTASSEDQLRISHSLEQLLSDAQQQLEAHTSSLHDLQGHRDELLLQIESLQSQLTEASEAGGRSRDQTRELQADLEDSVAKLSSVTKALENVESERNSLRVELVNLQNDVSSAQEELKQAEKRYSTLQTQQLSSMSTTQVNHKLREQIDELEGRVARRTEQIGIHQHDIKRLEMNLRIHEDRIAEMTSELEVAMSEKESMVEDCAEARETRDRALEQVERLEDSLAHLETQVQVLEEQRDKEVAALVQAWSTARVQSRTSAVHFRAVTQEAATAKEDMSQRLLSITAEHESAMALLDTQATELLQVREAAAADQEEAKSAAATLVALQTASAESQRAAQEDRERIDALLSATRDELGSRLEEISALQEQLQNARAQAASEGMEQHAAHLAEVTKLEEEVGQLQEANADLVRQHSELKEKLALLQDELLTASTQRDQLEEASNEAKAQVTQLQADHSGELEDLRGKLQQVAVDLQEAREAHAAAEKACEELTTSKAELEERLALISTQQDADSQLIAQLQSRESGQAEQLLDIQSRFSKSAEELQQTIREKDELEILLQQTQDELSRAGDSVDKRVADLMGARDALQASLNKATSQHTAEMDEVHEQLKTLQDETDSLRNQLDKAIADRTNVRATFESELRTSSERYEAAIAEQADTKAQLSALEAEVDDMESRLEATQEQKDALEAKNTNLESELQRAFSMQRYVESQLKDSERDCAVAKAALEEANEKFAHAERDGKAAEMQLTFQASQHEQALNSLRREIQTLQAMPRQDDKIQELEERIDYMDELMRSKTQEIEENDDRFIELHKERKKLNAKVETLTRKVQTLQGKVAALKDAAATNQQPTQPIASSSKQSPAQLTVAAVPAQFPAAPAPVQSRKSTSPMPSAPVASPSRSRAISGPSTSFNVRTPDSRPAPSVFRARTPEPAQDPFLELRGPLPTTAVAGKKRAAPDDSDEVRRAQGFTSDGVLATNRNAATTPRRRKSLRTGFTPVRNTTTQPMTTLAADCQAPAPAPAPPVISDVTNSPRGKQQADAKVKRSWLGMRKTKPTQSSGSAASRTMTTSGRGTVFERAP